MSGMTLTMLSLFGLMIVGVAASLISVRWSYRYEARRPGSRRRVPASPAAGHDDDGRHTSADTLATSR